MLQNPKHSFQQSIKLIYDSLKRKHYIKFMKFCEITECLKIEPILLHLLIHKDLFLLNEIYIKNIANFSWLQSINLQCFKTFSSNTSLFDSLCLGQTEYLTYISNKKLFICQWSHENCAFPMITPSTTF